MNNSKVFRTELRLDYKSNQKLNKLIKKSKLPKSEIIRRLINEYEIKEMPKEEFFELLNGLIQLGDNLQVISDKAEYLNEIDKDKYRIEVQKIDKLITLLRTKYL